jgi:hypothetical protein
MHIFSGIRTRGLVAQREKLTNLGEGFVWVLVSRARRFTDTHSTRLQQMLQLAGMGRCSRASQAVIETSKR